MLPFESVNDDAVGLCHQSQICPDAENAREERVLSPSFPLLSRLALFVILLAGSLRADEPFAPDESTPPKTQPAPAPASGATVAVNPPSLIWKTDDRAVSYTVEFSPTPDFTAGVIRAPGIPYAYYNHSSPLAAGTWSWRYFVVDADGKVSAPSRVMTFVVSASTPALALPNAAGLIAALPAHPRIFTTPATLAEFRARREGAGKMAWEQVRLRAGEALKIEVVKPELLPLPETLPPHRRQIFWVEHGTAYVPKNYTMLDLNRDAERAELLSLAYLISGEERYADAAKRWALFVVNFRMDYHLKTVAERGQHDTVVYAYERGLKGLALTYDRLFDRLTPEERRALLDDLEFHGEAAMYWVRNVMHLHRDFQDSHGQQCMHMTLTLALAIAGDSMRANEWLAYLVPQYANRIPWMSEDGGYFEGQSYAFKLSYILETLAALRTATGLDLFQKPELTHAGDFWLYCQSMNYWWPQWGDTMGLWFPYGNVGDAYMSALLAAMTNNRPLQWWSNRVPANDAIPPLGYLAATGVKPQPPVSVAQARAFVPTGVVAAFDRHYDEATTRLFFRSSPWGGESHAHADQNSFVLHSGGEIFAADTGYYTYFGDENYNQVSTQTISHNSVLVDGQGQSNDINGEGRITGYFHSPRYTFMAGDASKAYGPAMKLFRRDMLFVRPNLVVISDELSAPQPARFTWLFNSFAEPQIDAAKREFTITERGQELWVKQVFPESLRYEASNAKLTPRKSKTWTRYTEAFPEPWKIRSVTEAAERSDIVSVLRPYAKADGRNLEVAKSTRDEHGSTLELKTETGVMVVTMRRRIAETGEYGAYGVNTDARMAVVERDLKGRTKSWTAIESRKLTLDGRALFESSMPVSIAWESPVAAVRQISVTATTAGSITLPFGSHPKNVFIADAAMRDQAAPCAFAWSGGRATFSLPAGEHVIWIEPKVSFGTRPTQLDAKFEFGGARATTVPLETATAENGDWVAYATLVPEAPGVYELSSSDPLMEILVRDNWDPERAVRGRGKVRALIGDHSEIILRFAPAAKLPAVTAALVTAVPLSEINLIRNGDCEAGLPGYPPRGWSVQNGVSSETYGTSGEQGWPGWSQEDAASGKASLKFIRPLNHTVDWRVPFPVLARNQMVALAPPVRLLKAGRYLLSCTTKGTATTASVELETSAGVVHTLAITPSAAWEPRQVELDLPAGYTLMRVKFKEGGRDDQLLWADDFRLTPVGQK
jgi:hypothetical protein